MDYVALAVSLRLAITCCLVLLVIGVPIAAWLAYSESSLSRWIEPLIALPFVLPPTVLGFYLLLALTPTGLAFTFLAVLIGAVIINLPIVVQTSRQAFLSIDPTLMEASKDLGASRITTFFRIIFPLAWPGIFSGLGLAFAHSLGEFGVALMVGGNLQGITRTSAISIYESVQVSDRASAQTLALVHLVLCFAILFLIFASRKNASVKTVSPYTEK